jgi:hypothetical protein
MKKLIFGGFAAIMIIIAVVISASATSGSICSTSAVSSENWGHCYREGSNDKCKPPEGNDQKNCHGTLVPIATSKDDDYNL